MVLRELYFPGNELDYIYYSPISPNVEDIMDLLRVDLGIIPERKCISKLSHKLDMWKSLYGKRKRFRPYKAYMYF